jgi:hypothetical protein
MQRVAIVVVAQPFAADRGHSMTSSEPTRRRSSEVPPRNWFRLAEVKIIRTCNDLQAALRRSEEQVPKRLEVGLGLDDVVADGAELRHHLVLVRGRQHVDFAALFDPNLALLRQEINFPGVHYRPNLFGGCEHHSLEIGAKRVEPPFARRARPDWGFHAIRILIITAPQNM